MIELSNVHSQRNVRSVLRPLLATNETNMLSANLGIANPIVAATLK